MIEHVDCELCDDDTNDPFIVDGLIICGYCIPKVEMLVAFMEMGGTEEMFHKKADGQMMMEI